MSLTKIDPALGKAQIILVMGVTGVGKSTFIKWATGQDVKVGTTLDPCMPPLPTLAACH